MYSKNDVLFTIVSFGLFIVLASLLSGYLGSVGMKHANGTLEGFEGSEENIDRLSEKLASETTDVKDGLNIQKYNSEYKKITSLSTEYLEGLQLSALLELRSIDPNENTIEEITDKCSKLALLLKTLGEGVKSIKDIDVDNI